MGSFANMMFKNFWKRLFQIDQSSNTGVDTVTRKVKTGDDAYTSLALSDDELSVQPVNDDSVRVFNVKNKGGSYVLTVDTSGTGTGSTAKGRVLVGSSQVNALTQYIHFGIANGHSSGYNVDTWYGVPFGNYGPTAELAALGSSTTSSFNDTNPATSLTMTTNAYLYTPSLWYVPDAITIDGVYWFCSADQDVGDSVAAHLMSYDIDKDNGATGGDLSNGTVLADGDTIANDGQENTNYQQMTVQSADVSAGKVIIFAFAQDTIASDYTINATVKYHIQ
tara:strand:- start:458 stop:1294 length:837 start_codon:yes stop_codon:yes gene_type:complete